MFKNWNLLSILRSIQPAQDNLLITIRDILKTEELIYEEFKGEARQCIVSSGSQESLETFDAIQAGYGLDYEAREPLTNGKSQAQIYMLNNKLKKLSRCLINSTALSCDAYAESYSHVSCCGGEEKKMKKLREDSYELRDKHEALIKFYSDNKDLAHVSETTKFNSPPITFQGSCRSNETPYRGYRLLMQDCYAAKADAGYQKKNIDIRKILSKIKKCEDDGALYYVDGKLQQKIDYPPAVKDCTEEDMHILQSHLTGLLNALQKELDLYNNEKPKPAFNICRNM